MAAPTESFIWGAGGKKSTPESIVRQRKVAEAMMATGRDYSPIESWTQGGARVANALAGVYKEHQADSGEEAGMKSAKDALSGLFSGGAAPQPPSSAIPTPAPSMTPNATAAPSSAPPSGETGDREKQAFEYFTGQGYSPAAAAGIVGNLSHESNGLNTAALNPGDGRDGSNSIGLAQWNGPRAQALHAFAASQGKDPSDFQTQLAFVDQELKGSEGKVGAALKDASDPMAAAGVFAGYERPAGWKAGGDPSNVMGWQQRSGNAKRIFDAYGAPPTPAPNPQIASNDPNFMPQMGTAAPAAQPSGVQAVSQAMMDAGATPANQPKLSPGAQNVAKAMAASPSPAQPQAAPAPSPANSGADMQQLIDASANPWLSDGQRQVVDALIGQKMKGSDPLEAQMKQLQLQKLQKEVGAPDKPNVEVQVVNGRLVAIDKNSLKSTDVTPKDLPAGYRPATAEERSSYGAPADMPLVIGPDGKPTALGGNKTSISMAGENSFEKELGTGQAKMFLGMAEDGVNAKTDLSNIMQLRETLAKTPGGAMGGLQAWASSLGLKLGENAGAVEAADALLSRLTPAQRQGLPGSASDRDMAMFKSAIPKLSNTPEGNALIMDTMTAMAEYKVKQGEIATAVTTGGMTRADGMKALKELGDPLAAFKKAGTVSQAPTRKVVNGKTYEQDADGNVYEVE